MNQDPFLAADKNEAPLANEVLALDHSASGSSI